MELLIQIVSTVLLIGGTFWGISGAVGIFRFPDFFARLHAAGVTDTLCAGSILTGLMLQAGLTLISLKLAFVLLFLWFTSPVASHALARAALSLGLVPRTNPPGEDSSKP